MANVSKVLTKETNQNESNFEVITLSSDEEESTQNDKDVVYLFQRFILACRPYVAKESIKNTRSLFTEVHGQLTTYHDLTNMLERYCKEVTKNNADLYISLICRELKHTKIILESKSVNVTDSKSTNKAVKSVTFCDVSEARGFEPNTSKQNENTIKSVPEIARIEDGDDDDDFASKKTSKRLTEIANIPSTSSAYKENMDKTKGKISIKTLNGKQRKKLVAQLKLRLKGISNKIKILNRAELTLDEMDMHDSTYIKESRLKKRFDKTWNKLCKLLGRPPNTGRVIEKPVRASSTGNAMIDKAIAKFLKERHGSFPDYFDIRDIVKKTNQKHDLRMSSQVLNSIIVDIFTDIGNKIQRRRERDLIFNFGSHLLDDFKTEDDPAFSNEHLALQLDENRRLGERNLKQVFTKYTHLERYEQDDKLQRSDDEQDKKSSKKHRKSARLDPYEVMGKSKMKNESSGPPRVVNRDIISESDFSDDEQDPSWIESDDAIVNVDSDVPSSSQEISVVDVSSTAVTDESLSVKDESLSVKDESLSVKDESFSVKDESLSIKDESLSVKDESLSVKDESFSVKDESLSDRSCIVVLLSDNDCPQSPIFPITDPITKQFETSEERLSTNIQDLSNDGSKNKQTVSVSGSDCEIINDPVPQPDNSILSSDNNECEIVNDCNEHKQSLDGVANQCFGNESQDKTNNDCEIVNDCNERKQSLDGVANQCFGSESQEETSNDCEIVHSPKEQLHAETMEQPNHPSDEFVSKPHSSTDEECLIIDDSQDDDESIGNHHDPLKIQTTMPSDELTRTINTLREVFQRKSNDVQRADGLSTSSDQATESVDKVTKCVPDKTDDNDLIPTSKNLNSHTVSSISCSDESNEDSNCISQNFTEKTSVVNYDQPTLTIDINDTITSNLPPKHDEMKENRNVSQSSLIPTSDLNANIGISKNTITNTSSHLPASSTSQTSNVANPRKRKASSEFSLRIPKSSVKCLEEIAFALKNKRLKLPSAWVNSNNGEKTSNDCWSISTTSCESSTVTSNHLTSHQPTTLEEDKHCENKPQLINGKAKIDLQHKEVFRERTLNALKIQDPKPVCNDVNSPSQTASNIVPPTSVNIHEAEKLEVIVIDD